MAQERNIETEIHVNNRSEVMHLDDTRSGWQKRPLIGVKPRYEVRETRVIVACDQFRSLQSFR